MALSRELIMYTWGGYTFIETADDLPSITEEHAIVVFLDIAAAAEFFEVPEEQVEAVFNKLHFEDKMATEAAIEFELGG